jgi:hypothetical protein
MLLLGFFPYDSSRCHPALYLYEERCLTLAWLTTRCNNEVNMIMLISAGTQGIGRPTLYSTRTQTPSFNAHSIPRPPICVARYMQLVAHIGSRSELDALRETLSQMSKLPLALHSLSSTK